MMNGYTRLTGFLIAALLTLSACSGGSSDDPIAMPDASDFQRHSGPFRSEQVEIVLQPTERTEFKAVMAEDQMMMYQWYSLSPVYVDFHGHDPDDDSYWYRYEEQNAATSSYGSLKAPVTGEHGWYFRNDGDREVVIQLRVAGYFDSVRNLGIFPTPES
jgi:hypothetical protein